MRLQINLSATGVPPLILAVFVLSLLYWTYLGMSTRMDIAWDARNYEYLGRSISQHGFVPTYFQEINREPVYPLLIAGSMRLAEASGLPYTKIMAFFGIALLASTQVLLYALLKALGIRNGITAAALAYFGISPAITNGAFSLYSEIAAYPFGLGIVLVSLRLWQAIEQKHISKTLCLSGSLAAVFAGATLVKAIFECVFPIYMLTFLAAAAMNAKAGPKNLFVIGGCLLCSAVVFYAPITGYKSLNQIHNGNFAVTNRGSWALYGNTARRMQPMTGQLVLGALAYAPGEGLCQRLLNPTVCSFWSARTSDALGMEKWLHLSHGQQTDHQMLALSFEQIRRNPPQYLFLTIIEGIKMLFWESTHIGFVFYPPWLQRLYSLEAFNNGLRLVMGLLSGLGLIFVWRQCLRGHAPAAVLATGLLAFLVIGFYSLFFILTRYALPLAPLYLVGMAYTANSICPKNS